MTNTPPLAPTLSWPPNDSWVTVSEPAVFDWAFNDPGDVQSSASLRYKVPAGAWTTLTDVVGAPTSYILPGGTLTTGILYEWQVQTKDSIGQWSPWSASRFVNTITVVAAPTITAPADFAVITTSPVSVAWTIPAGFTQDAYRVQVVAAGGVVYYDSGVVESIGVRSLMVPLSVGAGVSVELVVEYRYNGYWSVLASIQVTNAVLPPEVPLLVLEQTPGKPEVIVSITNPAASDASHLNTASNDLYRDGVHIKAGLAPNSTYVDRLPGAGPVDYRAVAITASGGTADSF